MACDKHTALPAAPPASPSSRRRSVGSQISSGVVGGRLRLGASAAPPSLDRLIGEELVARLEKKEVPNGEEERAGRG